MESIMKMHNRLAWLEKKTKTKKKREHTMNWMDDYNKKMKLHKAKRGEKKNIDYNKGDERRLQQKRNFNEKLTALGPDAHAYVHNM